MLTERLGSQHTVDHKPATNNLPKCKSSHEATRSETFNVSISKDKIQGPTHGSSPHFLAPSSSPHDSLASSSSTAIPLPPTPDCTAVIPGIHTYTVSSHLYNFTPLSLFHQPSSHSPDEISAHESPIL